MRTTFKDPRVTLVGAGPGDPELITVKAVKAIRSADVVLFDALVSAEILDLVPAGIPAFSVGKRAGSHSHSQDTINQLIVEMALLYGHVVRLKGGDPFVFGRGSEEAEYAISHGVAVSVIPGISSAIAVPASAGIPVTARGVSESFWVVTGTTKSGALSADIAIAAQSTATVVILMGIKKLEAIMDSFSRHGKKDVPVAVVLNGTLHGQRTITGTVTDITAKMSSDGGDAPGVIIIGEVARYAERVSSLVPHALPSYG